MAYRFLAPDGTLYDVPDENFSTAISQGGTPIEVSPTVSVASPAGVVQSYPVEQAQPLIQQGFTLLPYTRPLRMLAPDSKLYDVPGDKVSNNLALGGRVLMKQEVLDKTSSLTADPRYPNWVGRPLQQPIETLKNGGTYLDVVKKNQEGRAGFVEGLNLFDKSSIPYLGSAIDAVDLGKAALTAKRISDNDMSNVSDQDLVDLNLYLSQLDRQSNASFWGKVGNVLKGSAVFGAEIASSLALMPLFGAGAVTTAEGAVARGTVATARKAVTNAAREWAAKQLGIKATKVGGELVFEKGLKGTAAKIAGSLADITITPLPTMAAKSALELAATGTTGEPGTQAYNQRKLFNALSGSDEGHAATIMRSLGDAYIEYLSEASGAHIMGGLTAGVAKIPGAATMQGAGKALSETFERWAKEGVEGGVKKAVATGATKATTAAEAASIAAKGAQRMKAAAGAGAVLAHTAVRKGLNLVEASDYLVSAGYDGVLPEMLEERLGGFLRGLFGIQGDEAGMRNAFDQMFPSGEQLAVEAVSFATPIVLLGGAHVFVNRGNLQQWFEEKQVLSNRLTFPLAYHQKSEEEKAKIGKETAKIMADEETAPTLARVLERTKQYQTDTTGLLKVVNSIGDYVAGIKYVPGQGLVSNPNIQLAATMMTPIGDLMVKSEEQYRAQVGYETLTDVEAKKAIDVKAAKAAVEVGQQALQSMGGYIRLRSLAAPNGTLTKEQVEAENALVTKLVDLNMVVRDPQLGGVMLKSLSRIIDEGFGMDSEQVKLLQKLTRDVKEGLFLSGVKFEGTSAAAAGAMRAYSADAAQQGPTPLAAIGLAEAELGLNVLAEVKDPHQVSDSRLIRVLTNPDLAAPEDVQAVMRQFGFSATVQDWQKFKDWTLGTRTIINEALDSAPHEGSQYTDNDTRARFKVNTVDASGNVVATQMNPDGTDGDTLPISAAVLAQKFSKHKLETFQLSPYTRVNGTLKELTSRIGGYTEDDIKQAASVVGKNAAGEKVYSVHIGAQVSGDGRTLTLSTLNPAGYHTVEDFLEAGMKQLNLSRKSGAMSPAPEVEKALQGLAVTAQNIVDGTDAERRAGRKIDKEDEARETQAKELLAMINPAKGSAGSFELTSKLLAQEIVGFRAVKNIDDFVSGGTVKFAASLFDKSAPDWRAQFETFAQNLPMMTPAIWAAIKPKESNVAKGPSPGGAAPNAPKGPTAPQSPTPVGQIDLNEGASKQAPAPAKLTVGELNRLATAASPGPSPTRAPKAQKPAQSSAKPAPNAQKPAPTKDTGIDLNEGAKPVGKAVPGIDLNEAEPAPKIEFKELAPDLDGGPTSLAHTKRDGTIVLDNAAIEKDYAAGMPYLRGETGVYGPQKKLVLQTLGVSVDELSTFFASRGGVGAYKAFLRAHEESHVANLAADHAVYAEAAKGQSDFKLDPKVLAVEVRATRDALEQIGFYKARPALRPVEPAQLAVGLGIEFNGIQKTPGLPDRAVFTDSETGGTFELDMPVTREAVAKRLEEKRAEFKAAEKPIDKPTDQGTIIPEPGSAATKPTEPSIDEASGAQVPPLPPIDLNEPDFGGFFDDNETRSLAMHPWGMLDRAVTVSDMFRRLTRYGDPDNPRFQKDALVRSVLGALTRDRAVITKIMDDYKAATAEQIQARAKLEREGPTGHAANWGNIGEAVDAVLASNTPADPTGIVVEDITSTIVDTEAGDAANINPDKAITPWADTEHIDAQMRRDPLTRFIYAVHSSVLGMPVDLSESRIFQPLFLLHWGTTPEFLVSREAFAKFQNDSSVTASELQVIGNERAKDYQIFKDILAALSYEEARRAHWNLTNLISVRAADLYESSFFLDQGVETTPRLSLRPLNDEKQYFNAKAMVHKNFLQAGGVNRTGLSVFAEEAARVLGNIPNDEQFITKLRAQPNRWAAITKLLSSYTGIPVSVLTAAAHEEAEDRLNATKAMDRILTRPIAFSRRKWTVPTGAYSVKALADIWQDLKKANPGMTPVELAGLFPAKEVRQFVNDTFLSVPESVQTKQASVNSNLRVILDGAPTVHTSTAWFDPTNKRHPTTIARNQLIEDWLNGAATPAERLDRLNRITLVGGLTRRSGDFVRGQIPERMNQRELYSAIRQLFTASKSMPTSIQVPMLTGDKLTIMLVRVDLDQLPRYKVWQEHFGSKPNKVFAEAYKAAHEFAVGRLGKRSVKPAVLEKRSAQLLTPIARFVTGVEGGLPERISVLVFDDPDKEFDGWAGYLEDTEAMMKVSAADYSAKPWHMFKGGVYGRVADEFVHMKPLFVRLTQRLADAFNAEGKNSGLSFAKLYEALKAHNRPGSYIMSAESAKILPGKLVETLTLPAGSGKTLTVRRVELDTRQLGITTPTGGEGPMDQRRQLSYQVLTSLLSTAGGSYDNARAVMAAFADSVLRTAQKFDPASLAPDNMAKSPGKESIRALLALGVSPEYPYISEALGHEATSKIRANLAIRALGPNVPLTHSPHVGDAVTMTAAGGLYQTQPEAGMTTRSGKFKPAISDYEKTPEGLIYARGLFGNTLASQEQAPRDHELITKATEAVPAGVRDQYKDIFRTFLAPLRGTSDVIYFADNAWGTNVDEVVEFIKRQRVEHGLLKDMMFVNADGTFSDRVRKHELIGVTDSAGALIGVRIPGSLVLTWRSPNTPATVSTNVMRIDGDHPSGGHFITMHRDLVKAKGADHDYDPELSLRHFARAGVIEEGDATNRGLNLVFRMYDALPDNEEGLREAIDLKKIQNLFPEEIKSLGGKAAPDGYLYSWQHSNDAWTHASAAKSAIGRIVSGVSGITSVVLHAGGIGFQFDKIAPNTLNPGIGNAVQLDFNPSEETLPARVAIAKYLINLATDGSKAPEYNAYLFLNPETANLVAFLALYGKYERVGAETWEDAALRFVVQDLAGFLNADGANSIGAHFLAAARELNNIRTRVRGTKKQRLTSALVQSYIGESPSAAKKILVSNMVAAWSAAQEFFDVYRAQQGHRRSVSVSPGTLLASQETYAKLGFPVPAGVESTGTSIMPALSAEQYPQFAPAIEVTNQIAKHVFPPSKTLLLSPAGKAQLAVMRKRAIKDRPIGPYEYNAVHQAYEQVLYDRALDILLSPDAPKNQDELKAQMYEAFTKFADAFPDSRMVTILRVAGLKVKGKTKTADIVADAELIAGSADVFQRDWNTMPMRLQLLLAKYAARRWGLELHARGGNYAQLMSPQFHAEVDKTYTGLRNAFTQLDAGASEADEIGNSAYQIVRPAKGVSPSGFKPVGLNPTASLVKNVVAAAAIAVAPFTPASSMGVPPQKEVTVPGRNWAQDWHEHLQYHEGFRSNVYTDATGHATIGYGHMVKAGETFGTINRAEADDLLVADMAEHANLAREYVPEFDELPAAAKTALADLAFWGILNNPAWPKFKAAIESRDWSTAADELLNSTGTTGYKTLKASSPNGKTVQRYEKDAQGLRGADTFSLSTVQRMALDTQRAVGWDTSWPFIPADLGNASFREAIRIDPALSEAERKRILDFAPGGATDFNRLVEEHLSFSLVMNDYSLKDEWFEDPYIDRYGKAWAHTPAAELHHFLLRKSGFGLVPPKPGLEASYHDRVHYETMLKKARASYKAVRGKSYKAFNEAFRELEAAYRDKDRTRALKASQEVKPRMKDHQSWLWLERVIYDTIPAEVPNVPDLFTDVEYDREVTEPERQSGVMPNRETRTEQHDNDLSFSLARASDMFRDANLWIKEGGAPLAHRILYDMMNDVDAARQLEAAQQEKWSKLLGAWKRDFMQPLVWEGDKFTFNRSRDARVPVDATDKDFIERFQWAVTAVLQELRNESDAEARKNKAELYAKAGIVYGPTRPGVQKVDAFSTEWEASNIFAKLRKQGNRKAEQLDILELALESRKFFQDIRKDVNGKFSFILNEQPYLREKLGYAPMIFGMGYMDQESVQALDDVERAIRDASKDVGDTWFTGAEADDIYVKNYRGKIPPPTAAQIGMYSILSNGRTPRPDWNRIDMNQALLNLFKQRQHKKAVEFRKNDKKPYVPGPSAADEPNRRDLATIKQLRLTQPSFRSKEWTARTMPSEYRSYQEAYEQSRPDPVEGATELLPGIYVPRTMNVFKLRQTYVNEVYATALNKVAMNSMAVAVDLDGQPIVIAMPNLAYEGPEEVLTEGTWAAAAENLAYHINYLNKADPKFKPITVDFSGNVKAQIQDMVNNYLPKADYEMQESPYLSIAEFRAMKGMSSNLLKQLIQQPKRWLIGDWDALQGLMRVVQWTKHLSVGWSLFFSTALAESVIAGTGLKRSNALFHPKKTYAAVRKVYMDMHNADPDTMALLGRFTRQGVKLGDIAASDEPIGIVEQDIARWADRIRQSWGEVAAKRFELAMRVASGQKLSDHMFKIFSAMKLWAAQDLAIRVAEERGVDVKGNFVSVPDDVLREVSPVINDAYGGQNWLRYIWATPQVRQFLNFLMFAPNWTLSAWNIAGGGLLTQKLLGNYMDKTNLDFVFGTNWPAMLVIVLFALPNAVQAASYLVGQAAGAGDPDDRPFSFQNELGRKSYIDITPMARLSPQYTGEPSGKRRAYMRFGKQAYEVLNGWFTEPVDQFLRKLSQPAKIVLEQLTGRSPGSDWNLEFSGQGFAGWFTTDEEGVQAFMGSRTGYVAQKFIPMSLLQAMKDPQTFPANFVVPTSKGTSTYSAVNRMVEILNTYANQHQWSKVKVVPKYRANLEGLGRGVLDAAAANGLDPDKVLASAKGVVLGNLYRKFWEAMNAGDSVTMDKVAEQILRVGGSIRGLKASAKNRAAQASREVTPEMNTAIEEALK